MKRKDEKRREKRIFLSSPLLPRFPLPIRAPLQSSDDPASPVLSSSRGIEAHRRKKTRKTDFLLIHGGREEKGRQKSTPRQLDSTNTKKKAREQRKWSAQTKKDEKNGFSSHPTGRRENKRENSTPRQLDYTNRENQQRKGSAQTKKRKKTKRLQKKTLTARDARRGDDNGAQDGDSDGSHDARDARRGDGTRDGCRKHMWVKMSGYENTSVEST